MLVEECLGQFLLISRFLRTVPVEPRMFVLENTSGIGKKAAAEIHSPLDFVMKGVHEGNKVGLDHNARYRVLAYKTSATKSRLTSQ